MPQSLQYTIKSFFLAKPKLLVIEPGFVTFGTAVLTNGQVQKLMKANIAAIRFGVRGIRGYSFNFGRLYSIDIKSKEDDIVKIRFRSFYGVRKQLLDTMYLKIIKALQDNFIHEISRGYIKKFAVKENFTILGITFTQEGLILDKKWALIPWLDVSTKNYSTYYAVFSMTEPDKYKAFKYANDWDTTVLYGVSRAILRDKGFWREQ